MTKNNMKQSTSNDWVRVMMTLTVLWCCLTNAWADDVTAEQAKAQAQIFLQSHLANGMRKGTKGTTLQLSKEMVVNGLYVFNVGDNRGFVVVSNDDSATPILGFSDSGSIDPDNMPSSMRAWLAGYADEIAWLQKNGNNTIVPKSALAKTSSWNVGEPKTPIAPLLRTTWDQDEPYNNLCPEYATGKKSATGCVATAMAQVMNYYQWPTSCPALDAYTTSEKSLELYVTSLLVIILYKVLLLYIFNVFDLFFLKILREENDRTAVSFFSLEVSLSSP